jgi:hypothetical protein
MQDLTKITTPFGLLDEETQKALRGNNGPLECYEDDVGLWLEVDRPHWFAGKVYRVKPQPHKPQPQKPREFWIVGEGEAWDSYEEARASTKYMSDKAIIHVREVIEQ